MKKICLDCGFGMGEEIYKIKGSLEGINNLKLAEKTAKKLVNSGFIVVMTRTKDEYMLLEERIRRIEESEADIAISIDSNWSNNPNQKGIETYYGDYEFGELFAKKIHKELINSTRLYNRGFIFSSDQIKNDIYLLTKSKVRTIVILLGFYTNPTEREMLLGEELKEKFSDALVNGVIKYLNNNKKAIQYKY